MRLRPTLLGAALVSVGAAPLSALAQDGAMRQLDAHVHGAARLAVAAEPDGAVVAELNSPAYNLYVFEHAPRTDAQRQVVADAAATLASAEMIGFSSPAGCTLIDAVIAGGPDDADARDPDTHDDHDPEAHAHEEHGHQNHEPHDHSGDHHDEHGHSEHDHGDEDHADHDSAASGHADVLVSWTYACTRTDAINQVNLGGLFDAFPAFETVETQFFDGERSAAADLTAQAPRLRID